jgi:probable H4MPT-linked C1 transfer pathway protein
MPAPPSAHSLTRKESIVQSIIGWDIGGAHVKAARIENNQVRAVHQRPCPLWQGADRLAPVLISLQEALGPADRHVATMTGELVDVFPNRRAGVLAITEILSRLLPSPSLYAGPQGFIATNEAPNHLGFIASANWHASAALAARHGDALFIDIGSTTTDIIPLLNRIVHASGYTDAERLVSGELVYTGLTRSYVMALAPRAPFAGTWTTIAAEYFASTADIYRILGTLDEKSDQMETADAQPKTQSASRARLARMIGRDAADASDADWHALATWFAEQQLRKIHDGAHLVLSRIALPPDAPVIAAGVGAQIVHRVAERLNRPCHSFASLFGSETIAWVDACAPAVAVALLASHQP